MSDVFYVLNGYMHSADLLPDELTTKYNTKRINETIFLVGGVSSFGFEQKSGWGKALVYNNMYVYSPVSRVSLLL